MTTGQEVFELAIQLMNEQSETSGSACTEDTQTYLFRTPGLLRILCIECVPACRDEPRHNDVTSLSEPLGLDDDVARGALPYGLAARLLLGENDVLADFFEQKFRELLAQLRHRRQVSWEQLAIDLNGLT